MTNKILQSVINITKQREIESLDRSLLSSLAEHLPCKVISLFKLRGETKTNNLEKILSLSVQNESDNEFVLLWNNESEIVSYNKSLDECLSNRKNLTYRDSDNQLFYVSPLFCDETIIGVLEICAKEGSSNAQELIDELTQIYGNCLFHINKSERDKLTGLLNRHSFDTKFRRLIKDQQIKQRLAFERRVANKYRKLSDNSFAWLAIYDIDHFKRVNDQYGHVCGDEVLLKLSQKMKSFFRSSDLLFRFGGEEFLVILEPIPHEMAHRTLERFREKIEESTFPLVKKITISGGYIKITDGDYPMAFIERADQALYYAKSHGRNKVCNYESLVNSGELSKAKELGSVDLF